MILDTYFETVPGNYVLINNVEGAYPATTRLARSTVHVPRQELGRAAAARLIEMMEKKSTEMLKTRISATLVLRDSVK